LSRPENIIAVFGSEDLDLGSMVKTSVFLRDIRDFGKIYEVCIDFFAVLFYTVDDLLGYLIFP